jgi:hypothetical protein
MQFVPEPIRIFWLLMVAALLPLAALVYWLWRVRLRPKGFRHYAEGKAFLNGS